MVEDIANNNIDNNTINGELKQQHQQLKLHTNNNRDNYNRKGGTLKLIMWIQSALVKEVICYCSLLQLTEARLFE